MGPQRRLFWTAQPVDLVCAVEPKTSDCWRTCADLDLLQRGLQASVQPVDLGLRAGGLRHSCRIRLQLCMRRRELPLQLRHLQMYHRSVIMMTADGHETKDWPHLASATVSLIGA